MENVQSLQDFAEFFWGGDCCGQKNCDVAMFFAIERLSAAARRVLTEVTVLMSINFNGICLCIFFSPFNGSNSVHVVRSGFFKNVVRLHLCPSVLSCLSRAAGL